MGGGYNVKISALNRISVALPNFGTYKCLCAVKTPSDKVIRATFIIYHQNTLTPIDSQ
jgi:hypothetical protein